MELFYTSELTKDGNDVSLPQQESHHISKVLRKKSGETINLTNGRGLLAKGKIISIGKEVTIAIFNTVFHSNQPLPNLAVAPPKSIDRMMWLVEKATELGVASITPLYCHHSERQKINAEKLQKTAIAAMKQSKRTWLPQINPIIPLEQHIESLNAPIAFGTCSREIPRESITKYLGNQEIIHFLIGPEGDFSKKEITMMLDLKGQAFHLGKHTLRTETAAISLCQSWQIIRLNNNDDHF